MFTSSVLVYISVPRLTLADRWPGMTSVGRPVDGPTAHNSRRSLTGSTYEVDNWTIPHLYKLEVSSWCDIAPFLAIATSQLWLSFR
jgi:hypothetical protein